MLNKLRIFFETSYAQISSLSGFIRKVGKFGFSGVKIKDLHLIFRGFFLKRQIPYNFKENSYSDYITDIEQILIGFVNHPYNKILNNKLLFSIFFKSYFNTPTSYCLLKKGIICNVNPFLNTYSIKDITSLLYDKKKLVIKPNDGSGGYGIFIISQIGNDIYLNEKIISEIEFERFLSNLNHYIVTDFVEQGNFTSKIYPGSTNTLRIITMIDPSNGLAFIPIAILRIGTSSSKPVDNFPKGGIFTYINIDTGILGETICKRDDNILYLENHPETGKPIKNELIPGWNKIVESLLNTANLVSPFLKIVGWDVVITDDCFVVIEGNSGPDMTIQGLNNPLAKDKRVLNFLKLNKVRR